jgi:protein disulfide-isomerase A1
MRTFFLALGAAALFAAAHAAEFPEEDDVLVLDDDNFDDAIAAHETLLVEFYAPWCGHCKKLAPEYAKAAATLKADGFRIAKVDATENRALGDKYEVRGFPTLKFFRNGKPTEYTGGRTEDTIVSWIRKKSGPPSTELKTVKKAKKFIKKNEVAVIGFFDDAEGEAAATYNAVAGGNDEVPFGITTNADVRAAYAEDGVPASGDAIVLFKKFDDGKAVVYDGDLDDEEAMASFVANEALPLVIPFSQQMAPKIFSGPIKVHFLLFIDGDDDESADILAEFKQSSLANKGRALHITVAPEEDRVMGYFDIKEDDLPTAVLVNMPDDGAMKKYAFPAGSFSADGFKAFVDSFFDGELKPFLKSEPVPEDGEDYDGHVKVIVGKSFADVALDQDKDVLVEFYAPWCGHCKALAPEYEKAAERFKDVDSVVIAKVDATGNEVDYEGVDVKGFPTLYFFPAGKAKKAVSYDGPRNAEGIEEFLVKNANSDFELPEAEDEEDDEDKDEL